MGPYQQVLQICEALEALVPMAPGNEAGYGNNFPWGLHLVVMK